MQQMLHQDKFTYQIEVDENLATDMEGIPPMFAQPIIENALEHGLFHKSAENHIHIAFQKLNDQQIKLTISDNGTGFQNAQSEVNHQS